MHRAIQLAFEGMRRRAGGPFGALVVKEGRIVGEGYNQVALTNDPTAHAEVVAIREACRHLNTFQLDGCTLYASCEPCPMCLGAIYWARPAHLVFAASRHDAAAIDFDDAFIYDEIERPHDHRRIPTRQLMREEGLAPFAEWRNMSDKFVY